MTFFNKYDVFLTGCPTNLTFAHDVNGIPLKVGILIPIQIMGTVETGSAAGNLILQWAQNTSDTTGTTVKEGSYLKVEEI